MLVAGLLHEQRSASLPVKPKDQTLSVLMESMSTQGILNSVFSCLSTGTKTFSERKLQQTRSLDVALIRNCGTHLDENRQAGPVLPRIPTDSDLGHDPKSAKGGAAWDLLCLAPPTAGDLIFSSRKWLLKSPAQVDTLDTFSYSVQRSAVRNTEYMEVCLWF